MPLTLPTRVGHHFEETPQRRNNPARQHFTLATLTLRGLINVSPQTNGAAFEWFGRDANLLLNGGLGYAGDLIVVGRRRGRRDQSCCRTFPTRERPTPELASATGGLCLNGTHSAPGRPAFRRPHIGSRP